MSRLTLFWQVFLAFGLLILLSVGALGGVIGAWVENQALSQVEEHLKSKALLVREIVRGRPIDSLRSQVEMLREKMETRITLIAPDGRVLVESERDPEGMDNHGKRPEFEAARRAPF